MSFTLKSVISAAAHDATELEYLATIDNPAVLPTLRVSRSKILLSQKLGHYKRGMTGSLQILRCDLLYCDDFAATDNGY